MATESGQPKVFISYSWTNELHVRRVNDVADYLEGNGIWVEMDRYLEPGENLYSFMEKMVRDPTIDKVFCFCDRSYTDKSDHGHGGVGTEKVIITKDVYEQVKGNPTDERQRFVAIAMEVDEKGEFILPIMFKTVLVISMIDPSKDTEVFEELARVSAGKPRRVRQVASTLPEHLRRDISNVNTLGTAGKAQTARIEARNQGPQRGIAALKDYLYTVASAIRSVDVDNEQNRKIRIDQLISKEGTIFKEFADVVDSAAQFIEAPLNGIFEAFFQESATYNFSIYHKKIERDFSRIFTTEAFVITFAALIRHRRFEDASSLAERKYWSQPSERIPESYSLFSYPPEDINDDQWLTEIRKSCIKLSGVAEIDYYQADILLFLRGAFHYKWDWNTTLSSTWGRVSLPLVREITSLSRARPLEIILNMKFDQIVDRLKKTDNNNRDQDPLRNISNMRGSFANLMNRDYLVTIVYDSINDV